MEIVSTYFVAPTSRAPNKAWSLVAASIAFCSVSCSFEESHQAAVKPFENLVQATILLAPDSCRSKSDEDWDKDE